MKSKLHLIILFLAFIGLGIWAYPVVKKRYFTKEPAPIEKPTNNVAPEQPQNNQPSSPALPTEENPPIEEPEKNPVNFLNITRKDCDENCKTYKVDPEELKYCQESCGLATPATIPTSCDELEGLDADYCFKDLAISKKDFKTCDKIKDSGIKQTCKNRITEDILNGLGGSAD